MPICEVGLSSTSSSSCTVDLRPMSERSGPFTFPLPPTIWQVEHCPFPKKNCLPATALPAGFVSKADIFRDRTQRASDWSSFSGRGNAGMPPHVPLLIRSAQSRLSLPVRRPRLWSRVFDVLPLVLRAHPGVQRNSPVLDIIKDFELVNKRDANIQKLNFQECRYEGSGSVTDHPVDVRSNFARDW